MLRVFSRQGLGLTPAFGPRILFSFGRKSASSVARRAVPIVAGFASAAYDSALTNNIGNTARDIFVPPEWVKEEQQRTGLGLVALDPARGADAGGSRRGSSRVPAGGGGG